MIFGHIAKMESREIFNKMTTENVSMQVPDTVFYHLMTIYGPSKCGNIGLKDLAILEMDSISDITLWS